MFKSVLKTVCAAASSAVMALCSPPALSQALPTVDEVRTVADQYWEENAERRGVPGMIVAYSGPDGAFFHAYGTRDLDDAVSAEETVFRVASVSKVFVGIAAAQLAERGVVDLDADINRYLERFEIEDGLQARLTLRQLLTHQARLDERFFGDSARTADAQQDLGDHLADRLPPRIGEPDGTLTYSNYGYALAAFVLEEASDTPFHQYVRENILAPLGMTSSGYRLDEIEAANLATGYVGEAGELQAQPYTYVHRYPSTSMMVTAQDMARFLSAMTQNGCLNDTCILGEDGLALIYGQQATHHASLAGMTLAFMEWRGRSVSDGVWHDGSHAGFEAELMILPESGIGFFAAANNDDSGITAGLKWALIRAHLARGPLSSDLQPEIEIPDISLYEGSYQFTRRAHGNMEKIGALFASPQNLRAEETGHIQFAGQSFYPVAPDLFRNADGSLQIAFRLDVNGRASHFFFDWGGSPRAFARVPARESLPLVAGAVVGSIVFMLAGFIIAVIGRRKSGALPLVFGGLNLSLAVGFLASFIGYLRGADVLLLRLGEFATLETILAIPVALGVSAAASLGLTIWLTRRSGVSWGLGVNLAGAVVFLTVLNDWHLLGWNY